MVFEGKTRGTVQMFEATEEKSGKEINGIYLYLTQGRLEEENWK
jgi:hypothetical protein